jgi:hypothetical protein
MDANRSIIVIRNEKNSGHRRIPAGVTAAAIQEDHEEK